jgi:hypothetical protein
MCRWVWHLSECSGYHFCLYTGDVCSNPDTVLNNVIHSIQVNVEYVKIDNDLLLPARVQFTNHNPSAILHYTVTRRPVSGKRVDKRVSAEFLGHKPSLGVKRFLGYENASCRLLENSSLLWNQQTCPWIRAFAKHFPRIAPRYISGRSCKNSGIRKSEGSLK